MLRATLKSLLSRKLRLLLSGLAVVLGVMAVSAALVLSDTLSKSFDSLFQTVNENTDVRVDGRQNVDAPEQQGEAVTEPLPTGLVDRIRSVPGVADVTGEVRTDGARVVGPDGKVIASEGPPRFGISWNPDDELVRLRDGSGPDQPDEVALNASLAESGGFEVGDRVQVLTLRPQQTFTVSGIFGFTGDRDSFGGETYVAFTEPVAQQLMLGREGIYSDVLVESDGSLSDEQLRDRVSDELGGDVQVRTGEQVAEDDAEDLQQFLDIVRYVLLGFAGVALFVGTFLILNTFSILVAQRTRELALLRSIGASRRQLVWSVFLEAVVVGILASTLGLLAGVGMAVLLRSFFESFGDTSLPGGTIVPTSAIVASYLVGVLVTVLAATMPALRASRVAPIAALREAETPDRPLSRLTVLGAVPTALGVLLIGLSLFGGASLWLLLTGVLLVFIGVAMLTPVISRPVVSALGRLMTWSVVGKLGRRNSARNPRRTAITAAALMIGIALVTGVSVIADSLKSSLRDLLAQDLDAELIISTENFSGVGSYDPVVIDEAKRLPGVAEAFALYADSVQVGDDTTFAAAGDVAAMKQIISLTGKEGELRALRPGEFVVDEQYAEEQDLSVGDTVTVVTQRGGAGEMTLIGVYEENEIASGPVLSVDDATTGFRLPQPQQGFIQLDGGGDGAAVRERVAELLQNSPEVTVQDQSDFTEQVDNQINQFLVIVYVLLGLAIVIAVLGIVNTLALSILERTRELGLVRAVGMRRGQVARMVTIESVVISVFGALLGMAVGAALGTAVVKALKEEGIETLSFPWSSLVVFFVLAVVVGLLAAVLPAIRAARTNVLRAIAYE